MRVGDLAEALGISQSTCSPRQKLAEVGFVAVDKVGTASIVSVNPACCTGLPHAADVVMGTLATLPCCPEDLPADVSTRAMRDDDLQIVRDIYAEGVATRNATFETKVPSARELTDKWLPGHAWVAEPTTLWSAGPPPLRSATATATPASPRPASTSPRPRGPRRRQVPAPPPGHRGRRRRPVDPETSIFPRTAPPSLCTSAGYRRPSVRGSRSSTASGGTPCSSSAVANATDPPSRVGTATPSREPCETAAFVSRASISTDRVSDRRRDR